MSIASIPARLRAEARSTTSLDEDETAFSRMITNELLDIKSPRMWRGAVAELIGTALLAIFTIGIGMKKDGEEGPSWSMLQGAIGTGFFLAALISALSNVSGAHVNPAISIGFLFIVNLTVFILPGKEITVYEALGVEILTTFFLLFVTLSLVDPGRDDLAGSVPLMVGLTVTVNILFGANISGACMNPARSFGPAMILGDFEKNWIYWAGPMAGAVLGSLTYDWFFSSNPFEMNSLKKLTGKDDGRQSTGVFGIKENDKDLNLQIDDDNEGDDEATRSLLKEKLRREYTNGVVRESDRRDSAEFRRAAAKERFQMGSISQISSREEIAESNENINLGNLENAPESKV
ncbi:unnamed protein product [Candidula unifasciata]|uniref:Aquaporin n=1 Tax=Candidula unifasciata TaxID=100452 RepID=A0A8S3YZS7_9EUPU|nr:unnamed protein product [Candidula unifasciata]